MQLDLDELRERIGRELEQIETRSAQLSEQLEHLVVVEGLAQRSPMVGPAMSEKGPTDFRRAILGNEGAT
jgi:hypothetical protein